MDMQQNNVQSNDYIPQNSDAQALDETLADLVSEVSDLGSEVHRSRKMSCATLVLSIITLVLVMAFTLIWIIEVVESYYDDYHSATIDKPAVYVYADGTGSNVQNYSIVLTGDNIKTLYPEPDIINNTYIWDVCVNKNNSGIEYDNQNYDYLFWDAELNDNLFDFDEGFCVESSKTKDFLEEKLYSMGLNEKEVHDFVVYWLPRMNDSKYNLITFVGMDENDLYNQKFDLSLMDENNTQVGESFRVIMVYKPVNSKINITEQELTRFDRPVNKPYIIEWGGVELK